MQLVAIKLSRLCLAPCLALVCLSLATALVPRRAAAQTLIDGTWNLLQDEDTYNFIAGLNAPPHAGDPFPGDFAGLPITSAARDVAQAFDEAQLAIPEMQCRA